MLLVAAMMAAVWGLGRVMGAPPRQRLVALAGLWGAVVLVHLALPDGHPLRRATGGDAQVWAVLGAVVLLVLGYRQGIARLRRRAQPVAVTAPTTGLTPPEIARYARHIVLREIGGAGQKRLKAARVLVVGAGGLGSPALLYLAASGVGTIGIVDDDTVDDTNLQRQIIHGEETVGLPKVQSAKLAIERLNGHVQVRPYRRRLTADTAAALFADYDLILDGSDNFDTRHLVNETAARLGLPLVAAAMTQWEGQLSLWHPAAGGPCYACVFPTRPAPGLVPPCAEAGVAAPLPGILGSMMAMEAVKHVTGAGEGLRGRLLLLDALTMQTRLIAVRPRNDCAVCGPAARARWTDAAPAP